MPMKPPMQGQEARGDVLAGLAMWFLGQAQSMYVSPQGMSEKGQAIADALRNLGRKFKAPEKDLGTAELKFATSQYGAGPQPGGQSGPPQPGAMDMGAATRSSLAGAGVPAAAEGGA
jgi:hypothetical protein